MVIFIEGATRDQSHNSGALRLGFIDLIKKLSPPRRTPEVKMGADKDSTLRLLENAINCGNNPICLIDLDGIESTKAQLFREKGIALAVQGKVFFMVVEMESWFLSQPEILNRKYRLALDSGYFQTNYKTQLDPKNFILTKVRALGNRLTYNILVDGGDLLKKMDVEKLSDDFPDVARLKQFLNT